MPLSQSPNSRLKKNFPPGSLGIPALVVSGFLGAGKTTLIRYILQEAQQKGLRLAVVTNEFGELGIDQALLSGESGEDYVELTGGCVCCKLSNELLSSLQRIWERVRPDRVIVETSGVALPFETLMTFWREPVSKWVGESLAVVVVNAEQVDAGRDLQGTFEQQVSSADLLVLNKIDLVSLGRLSHLESVLNDLAPGTPIVRSVGGQVDTALLFPPNPGEKQENRPVKHQIPSDHPHESFQAQVLTIEDGVEAEALIQRLKQHDALRIKGAVQTATGVRVVQGVGSRIDLILPPTDIPHHLIGQIVVISRGPGHNLPRSGE